MVYICTKFHENILNGIRIMERTRKIRRTDGGHDITRSVFDGRIKRKGLNSTKTEKKAIFSVRCLIVLYICKNL